MLKLGNNKGSWGKDLHHVLHPNVYTEVKEKHRSRVSP